MRPMILILAVATTMWGQGMVEHAAAAAGGSAGGIAGKKVSDGLNKVFNKVDQTAAKAAKTDAAANPDAPLMEVGPGTPNGESVPPPPEPAKRVTVRRAQPPPAPAPIPIIAEPVAVAPPPPEMTAGDLKNITPGMNREQLLQRGLPASRVTMFEDGHLLEIFRYMAKDTTLGIVRLVDGNVAAVQMP